MAAGSFTVGATNYWFYTGSWGSGNVITSATGKTYSSWEGGITIPKNPTDAIAWIQVYKLNFSTYATYHTASYKGWVGSSSNNTFSDNTDNSSSTNIYSYQNFSSNLTFGAKTTNTGTFSTYRSNGTSYGTITDSHSNSWDGDIRCGVYYYTLPGAIPAAPTTTVNSPTSISLSWAAPADTGGTSIVGYRIEYSKGGGAWTAVSNVSSTETDTSTSYTFSADPLSSYQFRVAAITDMVVRLRTARSLATASGPFVTSGTATTGALTVISFPNVSNKGYSFSSATGIIQSNGFTGTASQTTVTSGANYTNYSTVATQSVTAGTSSTNPDTRSYSLGVYAATGTIPNVVGATQASAITSITGAGFASPIVVTTDVGATPSNTGKVASQSSVGTQSYGTVVTITVYSFTYFGSRITDSAGGNTPLTTGKRYVDGQWTDLTVFKRYDGTAWQDITNS